MKKKLNVLTGIMLTALIMFSGSSLFAQESHGVKNLTKKKFDLADFNKINIGGAFDLEVRQSDDYSVVVVTDANLVDKIIAEVTGGELVVKTKGIKKAAKLDVYVGLPQLDAIHVHGAADMKTDGVFEVGELYIEASGASNSKLNLVAKSIVAEVSGAANVYLSGNTNQLTAEASGAANLIAKELEAVKVYAEASGAGNVKVNALEELEMEESGAGNVSYVKAPPKYLSSNKEIVRIETGENFEFSSRHNYPEKVNIKAIGFEVEEKDDTVKVGIGNHKIIIDEDGNVVYRKKKNPKFNGHWGGFDLGINGYLTSDQRMDYSNIDGMNYNYLDLNMSKSIKVGINFFEQNLSLSKNQKWGLVTGLGWEINNYRFADKVSLLSDSSVIKGYYNDGVTVSKSKLVVNYLEVPLLLEFQTNKYRKSNSFHFTAGVVLGLRVTSHTKRVFEELNKEYYLTDPATGQQVLQTVSPGKKKAKTWDDFHLNPLKADATLRVGWGWINLFGTYSLTTLFKENKGPELYPFSIGLTLTSW